MFQKSSTKTANRCLCITGRKSLDLQAIFYAVRALSAFATMVDKTANARWCLTKINIERWSLAGDERISQLEKVVAEVKSDDIPILKTGILKSAVDWIERHPQTPANTIIGKVEFTKNNIKADFFHSSYPNKLATLPAVKAVLEKGVYLGKKQDKDGKPINNYYFLGTVKIDNEEKIVFVRVREAMGSASRFYVHEVYELEKIKNASRAFKTGPLGDYRARPAFYENIVADFINGVNQNQPRRLIPIF